MVSNFGVYNFYFFIYNFPSLSRNRLFRFTLCWVKKKVQEKKRGKEKKKQEKKGIFFHV